MNFSPLHISRAKTWYLPAFPRRSGIVSVEGHKLMNIAFKTLHGAPAQVRGNPGLQLKAIDNPGRELKAVLPTGVNLRTQIVRLHAQQQAGLQPQVRAST
jgi:hypothetical protein